MSNQNYGADLIKGLAPAIETPEIGKVFNDTTQALAEKIADEFRTTFGITETDKIIITPKLARNSTGISDVTVNAYFSVSGASGNVYYRGKGGANKTNEGRISLMNTAGAGSGGSGIYGTSEQFVSVMKPLCRTNPDNGKLMLNLRSVQGTNVASLELDFNAVMCLVLGITPNDVYDFLILQMSPIANTNNYTMLYMKYIAGNGSRKGKTSGINYARIEQDLFRRVNNNGGNNGGRNY